VKQVSPGAYTGRLDGGEARVCVVGANKGEEMSLRKEMGKVLSAQRKEMRGGALATGKGSGGDQVQPRSALGSNGGDDGGG